MKNMDYHIRDARPEEFREIGALMVKVYSQLKGFPKPDEQPKYYEKLVNIGGLTTKPETKLLVVASQDGQLAGALVYFGNMKYYGSGGKATKEKNAAAFRLLAVDPRHRGLGLGKMLTQACIDMARESGTGQMIIHSTRAMQVAWNMYENLGFVRAPDLDFMQDQLSVFGFRLIF